MTWNPYDLHFEHVHLEISSKCALKCPRCPRTEHPETPWLNKQLSLADIKKILPEHLLQKYVQRITICGDVGDPIYNTDFHEIIGYLKNTKPDIHLYIITNGSFRSQEWWHKTALLLNNRDTVAFSIDGYDQESNQKYRVGSDWKSIEVGMSEIAKSEAFMVWATIVFKFNQTELQRIQEIATERNCDFLQITKSTKFGKNYKRFNETSGIDTLQPKDDWISSSERFERSFIHLSGRQIDNFDFLKTMETQTTNNEDIFAKAAVFPLCKTGNRGLYVNVTGQLFPCSWVSFPYTKLISGKTGRVINFADSFFNRYADEFNLLKNDFDYVLTNPLWKKLFESFHDEKKCFIECENKCRHEVMSTDYKLGWFLN